MKKMLKGMPGRVLSVVLTAAMIVGLCPAMPWKIVSEATELTPEFKDYNVSHGEKLRLVLGDDITELPYVDGVTVGADGVKKPIFNSKYYSQRGTMNRPFTILEIVGYEEQAEIGYSVGGCEPVRTEELFGTRVNGNIDGSGINMQDAYGLINSNNTATIPSSNWIDAYFFADEREADWRYYSSTANPSGQMSEDDRNALKSTNAGYINYDTTKPITSIRGYYERVADNAGNFKMELDGLNADGTQKYTITNVGKGNGNIVWHTVNNQAKENHYFFKNQMFAADFSFLSRVENGVLYKGMQKIGDRYYTYREITDADPVYNFIGKYHYYENNEILLTETMGLSRLEAERYSVAVKTVSAKQINANPEWVDCADLVYILTATQDGGQAGKLWLSKLPDGTYANRVQHSNPGLLTGESWRTYAGYIYKEYTDRKTSVFQPSLDSSGNVISNDISWAVVAKIMDKITSSDANSYAPLMMEKRCFDVNFNNTEKITQTKSVKQRMYDRNFDYIAESSGMDGINNNVYKLALMTLTLNPNLVKQLFWKYIDKDGNFTSDFQTGDAQTFWTPFAFALMPDWDKDVNQLYRAFSSGNGGMDGVDYWQRYDGFIYIRKNDTYVEGRVLVYNSNSAIGKYLVTEGMANTSEIKVGQNSNAQEKFKDFHKYMDGEGKELSKASMADALAYILGYGKTSTYYGGTLRVLDIEPSVALNNDELATPHWTLTPTAVQLMLPNYAGAPVTVTHMTSSEFVGKIEDLRSNYDMIYLGADIGGFNTENKADWNWYKDQRGNIVHTFTNFNDDAMDGMIYFHVGDTMKLTGYGNTYDWDECTEITVGEGDDAKKLKVYKDYLLDRATGEVLGGDGTFRFPGNDITKLKKDEIEKFISAGRPVVAVDELYDNAYRDHFVDQRGSGDLCVMNKLLREQRATGIFSTSDTNSIDNKLRGIANEVVFDESGMPKPYNGTTVNKATGAVDDNSADIGMKDEDYLADSSLSFTFSVPTSGYSYKVYIDMDRNSKFTDVEPDECIDRGVCGVAGTRTITCPFDENYIGIIYWRIVVEKGNIHSERTGFSAIRPKASSKKLLKVLQIVPRLDDPGDPTTGEKSEKDKGEASFNLEQDATFKKYYQGLEEFDVDITAITWADFEKYFDSTAGEPERVFTFDISKSVSSTNPKKAELEAVEKAPDGKNSFGSKDFEDLSKYNMIIVGLKDSYGNVDLSDYTRDKNNSALMYLQYFAESGKSILYTHDITSPYNSGYGTNGTNVNFTRMGMTANAALRDQMGMNRYKSLSSMLLYMRNGAADPDGGLKGMAGYIKRYQDKWSGRYDTTYGNAMQGYTYFVMKRMGYWNENDDKCTKTINRNEGNQVPYRYMIKAPNGNYVGGGEGFSVTSGFNSYVDSTTRATMLNRGQVTEYPYKIGESLKIIGTHAEWYQLNMEDKDVTVWYCLANDSNSNSTLTYGVSPNDAANNYYIYSKGNIFYSGVGHRSDGLTVQEAKLFVNTMIAAYRQVYDAPSLYILNDEAAEKPSNEANTRAYQMQILAEFNKAESGAVSYEQMEDKTIIFKPEDKSFSSTLSCQILYKDGTPVTKIYTDELQENGTIEKVTLNAAAFTRKEMVGGIEKDVTYTGFSLKNGKKYYFDYDSTKLTDGKDQMRFDLWSNVSSSYGATGSSDHGVTKLDILTQPMFLLD